MPRRSTLALVTLVFLFCASCRSGSTPPIVDTTVGAPDRSAADARSDAGSDRADASQCPVAPSTEPNVVATTRGLLRGKAAGSTVAFLGVPYAEPPVGPRRFTAPVPRACWSGVRDAADYGSRCAQRTVVGVFAGDEDCLFLNVWTPQLPTSGSARLPVLFFIHGGANVIGGSNEGSASLFGDLLPGATGNLYDGETLATKQKVVVVSVNYRLGALGFLAHPDLSKQSPSGTSGNYALLDLLAALRWTKENIAALGGDPDRVMVFGESAGAANTCLLLVSPLAKGLFHAALMESGGCQAPPLATREAQGQKLATQLGCAGKPDVPACLRAAPASSMIESLSSDLNFFSLDTQEILRTWDLPWGANVDGQVLPDAPMKLLRAGKFNQVAFAIGSNAHEGELFLPAVVNTCLDYLLEIKNIFGALSDQILALYPCTDYTLARWAAVDVITDAIFTCPARRAARAVAAAQSKPVYRYHYKHIYKLSALAAMRAFHASELPFVFQTFSALAYLPTSGEKALSDAMQGYWARFGATGDPNGAGAQTWPVYTTAAEQVLVLDEELALDASIKAKKCDFWDGLSE
jgi:para-nitrobenzyl esterase